MNPRNFRTGLLLATLLTSITWLACEDAAAQESCASAQCHAELLKAKNVHPAAESCDSCHESAATPHPAKGKKTFKLMQEPPALCFACHEELGKKSTVHSPVQEGMCTTCHDPHASDQAKLLAEEGQALCFQCHQDVAEAAQKAAVPHGALAAEAGCATCHSPHAADNAKLLLQPEKETCLGCHADVITKNMTLLHGPIHEGRCTACHAPHGSQHARLLVKEFPAEEYVQYTDTEFELCFGCHKRELLEYPDTSFATGFRDGDRNLHYLHVNNAQKGRSGKMCHNVHGSAGPKLIAESVPFGKWSLPLKYVKTETGGGCSPGCHKPQSYDRKSPGKKPEAPKKPN